MSKNKKLPLSDTDLENARRLRDIWNLKKGELGLTQAKAADYLNFKTQGAVSHYLNGKTALNTETVLKFSSLLQVVPEVISKDFNYGHKEISCQTTAIPAVDNNVAELTDRHGKPTVQKLVPLISWVQAGGWEEAIDNFEVGDAEEMLLCPSAHGKHTFALHVQGDSMTNPFLGQRSYPPGTIIYIDPDQAASVGDRVIAKLVDDNKATFKVLAEDGGKFYLKPLNPQYPMIEINGNCQVVGRVIGSYMKE